MCKVCITAVRNSCDYMLTLSLVYTAMTHLSQSSVQTSQAPPGVQAAPRMPLEGLSGTPGPAACLRSYLMTSLESPKPHLSANKLFQGYCGDRL